MHELLLKNCQHGRPIFGLSALLLLFPSSPLPLPPPRSKPTQIHSRQLSALLAALGLVHSRVQRSPAARGVPGGRQRAGSVAGAPRLAASQLVPGKTVPLDPLTCTGWPAPAAAAPPSPAADEDVTRTAGKTATSRDQGLASLASRARERQPAAAARCRCSGTAAGSAPLTAPAAWEPSAGSGWSGSRTLATGCRSPLHRGSGQGRRRRRTAGMGGRQAGGR